MAETMQHLLDAAHACSRFRLCAYTGDTLGATRQLPELAILGLAA